MSFKYAKTTWAVTRQPFSLPRSSRKPLSNDVSGWVRRMVGDAAER